MTTNEAHEVLKSIEGLRESIDRLEWKALTQIACDRQPKLRIVSKGITP